MKVSITVKEILAKIHVVLESHKHSSSAHPISSLSLYNLHLLFFCVFCFNITAYFELHLKDIYFFLSRFPILVGNLYSSSLEFSSSSSSSSSSSNYYYYYCSPCEFFSLALANVLLPESVTERLLKSPGLFSVFCPILVMPKSEWS